MNIITLKIFLLLFIFNINITPQIWEDQSFNPNIDLHSILFLDTLNGWVVGDEGTLLKTTNGGILWENLNLDFDGRFIKIKLVDSTSLFILTDNSDRGQGFFISDDFGETWEFTLLPFDEYFFLDFHFLNINVGFITGLLGKTFKTIDGMRTWQNIDDPNNFFAHNSIFFKDENTGWITGGRIDIIGFIKKTTDAGETWNNLIYVIEPLNHLYMMNADTFWVAGGDPEYGGWVYLSIDSGNSWELQQMPEGVITRGHILFINKKIGFTSGAGNILETRDLGITWNIVYEAAAFFESISSPDGKHFWFCGSGGFILKYTDTTTILTSVIEEYKPKEFNIIDNINIYPNPFNNSTQIAFNINKEEKVNIYIYDILGKKIDTITENVMNVGSHKIFYENNYLASGHYLINFVIKGYIFTKKIQILK